MDQRDGAVYAPARPRLRLPPRAPVARDPAAQEAARRGLELREVALGVRVERLAAGDGVEQEHNGQRAHGSPL